MTGHRRERVPPVLPRPHGEGRNLPDFRQLRQDPPRRLHDLERVEAVLERRAEDPRRQPRRVPTYRSGFRVVGGETSRKPFVASRFLAFHDLFRLPRHCGGIDLRRTSKVADNSYTLLGPIFLL